MITTKRQAIDITGGLSSPGKMPGTSWSIPASTCKVGSRLRHVSGSVCESCYAADDWDWLRANPNGFRMSRYAFDSVKAAGERRLAKLVEAYYNDTLDVWAEAMAFLILKECERLGEPYHRWFDSGDIQDGWHLSAIYAVCRLTPKIKHWLPSKEAKIVRQLGAEAPKNLVIRISAAMIDGLPPSWWKWTSTSSTDWPVLGDNRCPAEEQDHQCLDCRKCWDKRYHNIDYHAH